MEMLAIVDIFCKWGCRFKSAEAIFSRKWSVTGTVCKWGCRVNSAQAIFSLRLGFIVVEIIILRIDFLKHLYNLNYFPKMSGSCQLNLLYFSCALCRNILHTLKSGWSCKISKTMRAAFWHLFLKSSVVKNSTCTLSIEFLWGCRLKSAQEIFSRGWSSDIQPGVISYWEVS